MSRDNEGFTLIEMLVSLALLSIMSVFSVMAISSMSEIRRVEQSIDNRSAQNVARRSIHDTLSDARLLFVFADNGQPGLDFSGTASSVKFVTLQNDLVAMGGLFRMEYAHDKARETLVLSATALRQHPNESWRRQTVLLHDVNELTFRYFGAKYAGQPEVWHNTWHDVGTLPEKIEISLTYSKGKNDAWRDLVVTLQNR